MLGTHDLALFVVSGLLLNITPGADSFYIATRSITQGVRAGVAAALGISLGCYVHIFAAALGLSAVLATSAAAFAVVKLAGAAYLIYVGLSLFRTRPALAQSLGVVAVAPLRIVFAQGLLTNVLNPKVALFFLAFVPQFIESSAPNKPLAFIFLGVIFNFNGTLWCLFLAWATARAWFRASYRRLAQPQRRCHFYLVWNSPCIHQTKLTKQSSEPVQKAVQAACP